MLITFSSIEQGQYVTLNVPAAPVRENTRRLSRSATLDGGAVITDSGYSDADRTFSFSAVSISPSAADRLWAFFESESLVGLACPEGFFVGYIESVKIDGDTADVSFLVFEKIT